MALPTILTEILAKLTQYHSRNQIINKCNANSDNEKKNYNFSQQNQNKCGCGRDKLLRWSFCKNVYFKIGANKMLSVCHLNFSLTAIEFFIYLTWKICKRN